MLNGGFSCISIIGVLKKGSVVTGFFDVTFYGDESVLSVLLSHQGELICHNRFLGSGRSELYLIPSYE